MQVGKRRVVVDEEISGGDDRSAPLDDEIPDRFERVRKNAILRTSGTKLCAVEAMLRDLAELEQHHVGADVARKFEEHRGQPPIVALACDVGRLRRVQQGLEQRTRQRVELGADMEFEDRIPRRRLITLDGAVPCLDIIRHQEIRVGPPSRMAGVVADEEVRFLEEQGA